VGPSLLDLDIQIGCVLIADIAIKAGSMNMKLSFMTIGLFLTALFIISVVTYLCRNLPMDF
jgi:hypothetical protein